MSPWKYDVFVSFRGEDIRKSFIDHLFKDFKQNGIHAFRDNIELPRGEEISPQLYKAIESSRILMVIFSKNYASSSWCLRELVRILYTKKLEKPKHEVQILFYDVKPEVVRKQTESYAEAFAKHEVSNRAEVDVWKEALTMASSLSGWDLNDMTNGYESKFIDCISKDIRKTLCDVPLHVGENLVGVDARLSKLNLGRFIGSSKVNMIGICGISGIGKTTIAKAIYNSTCTYFKESCFCEDVQGVAKRQGLPQVQKQFISILWLSKLLAMLCLKSLLVYGEVNWIDSKCENIDLSASVLDNINCFADVNIDVLVDKSLIKISPFDFSIQMHELIQSMAREVQRDEFHRLIRLWGPFEVYDVLGENNVTEVTNAVEVLVLLLEKTTKKIRIDCKSFSKMKKLRILKIYHREPEDFVQSFRLSIWTDFGINFVGSLDFLSNELRLLYWHGYPFKFLPSNFYPENVVAIDLSFSNIKSFWTAPKCFNRLKVMKLRHCRNLTSTPDFTEMVNLEELNLEGCVSLVKLHPSIGMLKKLVMLNVKNCIQIRSFPYKVEMDSLQVLILSGCLKLDNLAKVLGTLKSLVKLYVDGTAITILPSFRSSLTNLEVLEISTFQHNEPSTWWPSFFQKQPQSLVLPSLASLRSLTELRVVNCNISEVCHDIGALSCLKRLSLSGNNFTKLPGSLSQLSSLYDLSLIGCKKLEVLPELPPSLQCLKATQCTSLQEAPRLIHRQYLHCDFVDCPNMFGNVTIDSQVSMSQTQLIASSTTSHASTNQLSILVEYLGIQSRIREFFSGSKLMEILFNGNRIPQWFTNKSEGSRHDVKVELPPNWCYSKFKGYGVCVVFKLKRSCGGPPRFSVVNFDGAPLITFRPIGYWYENCRVYDTDTMIWLGIKACDWEWEKAKNFVTFTFEDSEYVDTQVEVKGCAVRLVCDDEDYKAEEETVLSMIQHLPPLITQPTGSYFRFFADADYISVHL